MNYPYQPTRQAKATALAEQEGQKAREVNRPFTSASTTQP
ncbi:MAG: hypothetical protein JWM16_630 [Verrucomicrobiales bacterium]|nr:hypothetical protein [Verrucomicrobiales bacterium]